MFQIGVVLVGGPSYLSTDQRIQRVTTIAETLKLPVGGGYEHFTHQGETTEVDGVDFPVFRWFMHTAIAE
ncbi:DUF5988 family protein [Sphaerisporangium sp. NPDC088356]|uniref:DUF5988 family protein n=1 Tax=Sphaerisporangium sp. NPDC088356 TaxID=3154871 RepID=UPI0034302CCB